MRRLFVLALTLTVTAAAAAAPLEGEGRSAYQLRVVVRTGDHPTLTPHFRTEVIKGVTSALQAALGPAGSVEGFDLNATPPEKRDPLWSLVDERGLEALDGVNAATGPKTHFVFVDFADGKYVIRTRQHDGSTGFVSPFVRTQVHGDRGFVARLAGLAVAQDFGVVGTFDPTGQQVAVVLKAGEFKKDDGSWALDQFVKKGDVFALVQIREARRAVAPKSRAKGKEKEKEPTAPAMTGTRIDGVLLHVADTPRNGVAVCRMYNRFRSLPSRDGLTVGYRCVKLGTGEGALRLQLTDAAGTPYTPTTLQPRAGAEDFPDPMTSRDREDMRYADGVFTSKEKFKNIAFVLVRYGDRPIARVPVEIYPDQFAVRKVNIDPASEPSPVESAASDLLDRIRSARVIQARCFQEVASLQKTEKPKALEYGEQAATALDKEYDVLRADLTQAKERFKADTPAGLFDPCEADLKALDGKTKELKAHLVKLKDVIRIENDPAAAALHKQIEAVLLDAATAAAAFDIDQAIAKYEEALKLAATEPGAKADIERALSDLRTAWGVKDPQHADARKFVYEKWPRLEKPSDVRDAMPQARAALAKCKAAGDKFTLGKMYLVAPQVVERYKDGLTKLYESAMEDEDRQALAQYAKVSRDLEELLTELGKAVGK